MVYFPRMKLISWNVNGLRSVLKKNFLEFLAAEKPDILCLQEIKCTSEDVEHLWPGHYTTFWNGAEKKGLFRHGDLHQNASVEGRAACGH